MTKNGVLGYSGTTAVAAIAVPHTAVDCYTYDTPVPTIELSMCLHISLHYPKQPVVLLVLADENINARSRPSSPIVENSIQHQFIKEKLVWSNQEQ